VVRLLSHLLTLVKKELEGILAKLDGRSNEGDPVRDDRRQLGVLLLLNRTNIQVSPSQSDTRVTTD